MRPLLVPLLLIAGCKKTSTEQVDPCVAIDDLLVDSLAQNWARARGTTLPKLNLRDTLQAACRREKWQRVAHETERMLETILPTHIAPAPDGGLAENGPHPDYPTPVAAGTQDIFFLEEPARGPEVPARVDVPSRSSLAWTKHAYCEVNKATFACSAAAAGAGQTSYRVGTKAGITVIEELYGDRVASTAVYTSRNGALWQRLLLDARGHIAQFYAYRDGKLSGRLRNGSNALDGCGYLRYATTAKESSLTCLQWLGEPMLDTNAVATYKAKRDDRGFVIEEANFGSDGKPIVDNTGKHLYRQERDAFGRVVVERYFDLDGKRVADPDGCSGERTEYEADGGVSRVTCLDDHDQARGRSSGIAVRENLYDARGCKIGLRYLDKAGKPASDPNGVHGEDMEVDRFCTETRKTCVDLAGNARECAPGRPAQLRMKLDGDGNAVSITHWASDDVQGLDEEFDAFELRYRYDKVGNIVALSCWNARGHAIECDGTGFHEKLTTYDANGRRVMEKFFATDRSPAYNLGASSRRYKYDNYDHPYESQAYGGDGALVEQQGASTIRELYDIRHQRFAVVLLDLSGKPARYTACFTGATCPDNGRAWHAVRIVRLGDGTVEYNQFFDEDGQLIEAVNCRATKCFD